MAGPKSPGMTRGSPGHPRTDDWGRCDRLIPRAKARGLRPGHDAAARRKLLLATRVATKLSPAQRPGRRLVRRDIASPGQPRGPLRFSHRHGRRGYDPGACRANSIGFARAGNGGDTNTMLGEARNRLLTEVGAWQAHGRVAAPLLAADRRRRRTRRHPDQAGSAAGRRPCAVQGSFRAVRAAGTALPASQRRSVLRHRRSSAACAATITAGGSTKPARAKSNRSRTPTRRRSASATRSASRRTRCSHRRDCCGPISAPSRRRCCRTGSRSPGKTASSRSCSRKCRATGSSARRTRSTRCISSGCTTTGAAGWLAVTAPTPRGT